MEVECRAKDKQLAAREAEMERIAVLRNELERLRVRMSEMSTRCFCSLTPLLPPSLPPYLLLQTEMSGVKEVCQGKDEVIVVKEQEIAVKQRGLSEAEQQVESLAEECAALKGRLEGKTEQILSLRADVQTLQVNYVCIHVQVDASL